MTLHLTATTTEEKVLKEYLEQTVSEVLADKINNGVPVEKDGKKLISKKTLAGFMKYATEEARKQAAKGATCTCLHSDIVFGWAIHYFEEDSIPGTLYNEDGTEYKAAKPATKILPPPSTVATNTPTTPTPKPKPKAGQMSMFDLFDEPETEAEETTETDKHNEAETVVEPAVEAPESPVEDEEPEVEVPTVEVKEPETPVISPLWTRYQGYQEEYPKAVIAMRIGDFYEIFGESAETVSKPLELTVVSRDFGLSERVPMIGFPFRRADAYIEKLRAFTDAVVVESETEKRVLPKYQPVNGFEVDTTTGEIIEPEQAPDPYADTELMYKLYMLLDQKVEIVK